MEQKKSKVIIISIVVALVLIVGTIATVSLVSKSSNEPTKVASQKLSLGQKFLLDLDYEKAVAEFNAVIEIEPRNVDAYIGLADAYIGLDDEEKAIEALEKGYEATGDETIKKKLDELKNPEETAGESETSVTVTTKPSKENTITCSDVIKKVDEFNEYIAKQTNNIQTDIDIEFDITYNTDNSLSYIYLLNKDFISDEVRDELYEYGLPKDLALLKEQYNDTCMYICCLNGGYSFISSNYNIETNEEYYISISKFMLSDKYKMDIYKLDRQLYNEGKYDNDIKVLHYRNEEKICDFDIKNEKSITEQTIYLTYRSSNFLELAGSLKEDEIQEEQQRFDERVNYVIYDLLDNKV